MKTLILNIIFIFVLCFTGKASSDCIWRSSKAGLTVHFIAPCDSRYQDYIDSIVSKTVSLLGPRDTSLKILVIVSRKQLSFPGARYSNFFSIAYDTLRLIDDEFIFNYYWPHGGLYSKEAPLDINSTSDRTNNTVGIKIIYDLDYRLGETNWTDITKAIIYSVNNVDEIKTQQVRDTVRYNTNGWYVSLVTLDTFRIRKILNTELEQGTPQASTPAGTGKFYYVIAGIGILAVCLFFLRQKLSR